jgi:hypothetical protein
MPQPSVGIVNPVGATVIAVTATGFAQPTAGNSLAGMGYQINAGPIKSFGGFPPGGGSWTFLLTTSDCPTVGIGYVLTVYAGESPSGNFNHASVNFVRTS